MGRNVQAVGREDIYGNRLEAGPWGGRRVPEKVMPGLKTQENLETDSVGSPDQAVCVSPGLTWVGLKGTQ